MSVSLIDGHIDNDAPRMTDNEIIKALEYCTGYPSCPTDCPLYEQPVDCLLKLSKPTLNLINRQKAENKRLNSLLAEWKTEAYKLSDSIEEIKSEAVKEFAKSLIDKAENGVISIVDLPEYVKERTGES